MAVVSTPAIPLRRFPYGETSLILRFYARELGVVGVMAKGARKRGSRGSGVPETFARGVLTVYVKETRGLQTMKDFAPEKPRRRMGRDVLRFAGASVLGEVVMRHAGEEGNPGLFERLDGSLDRIEEEEREALLARILAEGWGLVGALGYRPVLDACVECGQPLDPDAMGRFDFGAGGIRCPRCSGGDGSPRIGPTARSQLHALLDGETVSDLRRPRAHVRLLSDFVTYHVSGGHPLDSFRVLMDLVRADDA